ncbi:MAG: hypothetical protein Q9191_002693 [Dirinaria sp. TL-2023a]
MATYRNSSITEFFKHSTLTRSAKRPAPDSDIESSGRRQKSRSVSPKSGQISRREQASAKEQAQEPSRSSAGLLNDVNSNVAAPFPRYEATSIQDDNVQKSQKTVSEASTLSSSQGPIITSSQRIVKNGQVVIRNSDDEDSDSDASLRDIDEILKSRKAAAEATSTPLTEPESSILTPVGSCTSEPDNEPMPRTRASAGTRKATRSTSTSPRVPRYKFDLHSLVKRSKKDEISEAGMSKAKSALENIGRLEGSAAEEANEGVIHATTINPGMIRSVMKSHGDSGEANRLMMAIQRTEALQMEKSWSFFEANEEPWDIEQPPLTHSATRSWHHMLEDQSSRQQLFLGGFMGDIAINGDLPDELLLWLVNAVSVETREDLRYSYNHTLKDAAREVGSLIEPCRINTLFQNIGARREALNVEKTVVAVPRASRRTLRPNHNLSHDQSSNLAIEEAFGGLIDPMSDDEIENQVNEAFVRRRDLRSQLIHKLPATSPRLTLLRRRLSLAFFFQNPAYLSKPQDELVTLGYVSHHLKTEKYMIGIETGFAELGAMVVLLNVGVDNGDPPPGGIDNPDHKVFDKEVDELSYVVKSMSNQIKDAGALQTKKTEAKEILEDFNARLMYAVRTTIKSEQMFGERKIKECFQKTKEPQNTTREMSNGVVDVGSR